MVPMGEDAISFGPNILNLLEHMRSCLKLAVMLMLLLNWWWRWRGWKCRQQWQDGISRFGSSGETGCPADLNGHQPPLPNNMKEKTCPLKTACIRWSSTIGLGSLQPINCTLSSPTSQCIQ